jgi:ubiquinone/menaquinone biosynthesis C-methylase UbiE
MTSGNAAGKPRVVESQPHTQPERARMPKSLVEQQFGPSARAYAECEVHRSGESLARLVDFTAPEAHWRALDVATGAGHTAASFAPHVAQVVASDITREMLEQAAALAVERNLSNVLTATAEAERLPFEDASFDLVTCRLAAHHFPDIGGFVREAYRVLRQGGVIGIVDNVTPDPGMVPGLCASDIPDIENAYNAFEHLRDPSHARALAITQWRQILIDTGFEIRSEVLLEKEMAFGPWVERMRCTPQTVRQLEALLRGPSALSSFLKPRECDGKLQLTLREALFVGVKAG